jgi:hypothetical protein
MLGALSGRARSQGVTSLWIATPGGGWASTSYGPCTADRAAGRIDGLQVVGFPMDLYPRTAERESASCGVLAGGAPDLQRQAEALEPLLALTGEGEPSLGPGAPALAGAAGLVPTRLAALEDMRVAASQLRRGAALQQVIRFRGLGAGRLPPAHAGVGHAARARVCSGEDSGCWDALMGRGVLRFLGAGDVRGWASSTLRSYEAAAAQMHSLGADPQRSAWGKARQVACRYASR